jgi:hypothetical protein
MLLRELFQTVLSENLSQASTKILNDKKLVNRLANKIRMNATYNATEFQGGEADALKEMPPEESAKWFLSQLDDMNQRGFNGTITSQDGQYNLWLVTTYANSGYTWKYIKDNYPRTMHYFEMLKRLGKLDKVHKEITAFTNGLPELTAYIDTHYQAQIRDTDAIMKKKAQEEAERAKNKSVLLVKNNDYKVYAVFNKAAAISIGKGTEWCTANTKSDHFYQSYTNLERGSLLYIIIPNNPAMEKVRLGNKRIDSAEKYQFDAGVNVHFNDVHNRGLSSHFVRERFPYIYHDITSALHKSAGVLQQRIDDWASNPATPNEPFTLVKPYNIEDEIRKLHRFIDAGYMSDEARPERPQA